MYAVIADQVGSREGEDRVPLALAALAGVSDDGVALPFERTAGDELQGLCSGPSALVTVVGVLTRLGGWRIGIGAGRVDTPLPGSTREARGGAYLAARDAITAARTSPTELALAVAGPDGIVTADRYGDETPLLADAETALWLVRGVLARRSKEGWELVDLLNNGLTKAQAAAALQVSPSAVSQRLARAHRLEADRGARLAARLLARLGQEGRP